eukprot:3033229-Prorocentrum_lima.AAC.1
MQSTVIGDWSSEVIKYHCFSCRDDSVECKRRAVDYVVGMLTRALFARRIIIPVASRWWKTPPLGRA